MNWSRPPTPLPSTGGSLRALGGQGGETIKGEGGHLVDEEGGPGDRVAEEPERALEEQHLPAAGRCRCLEIELEL